MNRCTCGAEAQWHGPRTGRRVFACAACYAAMEQAAAGTGLEVADIAEINELAGGQ